MCIAIIADTHICSSHPERTEGFERLLSTLDEKEYSATIIAGDLLDTSESSYGKVDTMLGRYGNMPFYIIPGNHDIGISNNHFSARNVTVIEQPQKLDIGGSNLVCVPYRKSGTMGGALADLGLQEDTVKRILVGHGDWSVNGYCGNDARYFPVTFNDIARYNISHAILGHIHVPHDPHESVSYVGSPFPLDPTETGPRTYISIRNNRPERHSVDTGRIFFSGHITCFPGERHAEAQRIADICASLVENWRKKNVSGSENVIVRINARGYTNHGKDFITDIIEHCMEGFTIDKIDTESLSISGNEEYDEFLQDAIERISPLGLGNADPTEQEVQEEILDIIYGV